MTRYDLSLAAALLAKEAAAWSLDLLNIGYERMSLEAKQDTINRFRADIEKILADLPNPSEANQ